MNTNRSSYLLGAALGSALVLALCVPTMAADIYDGGLKGGYDVPPPLTKPPGPFAGPASTAQRRLRPPEVQVRFPSLLTREAAAPIGTA
jgi:hypothetical protein